MEPTAGPPVPTASADDESAEFAVPVTVIPHGSATETSQPPTTEAVGPVLDAPFNGALQPAEPEPSANPIDQGSLLDQVSDDTLKDDIPLPPKKRASRQRVVGSTLLAVGVVASLLLGLRVELNKSKTQDASVASPAAQLQQQKLSLPSLSKQLGTAAAPVNASSSVTVNGSLVLAPSVQPDSPIPGQLYYDQGTNQVLYYDGTGFVHLQGGSTTNLYTSTTSNTYVTNVTNNSGTALHGTAGTLAVFAAGGTDLAGSLITQNGTTVAIATTGTNTVTVGSTTGASITSVQGGLGGVSISTGDQAGSSGDISITSGASSSTAAGNVTVDTGTGVVTGEVIDNKTFEDGTDNMRFWFGDTVAQSNTQSHSGAESLAITTTSQFWGVSEDVAGLGAPVIAGHHYFFSAWVRAGTASQPISTTICWDSITCSSAGVSLTTVTDSSTAWTEVTGSAVAPGGATHAYWVFTNGTSGVGETHYLDDLTVTDLSASSSISELNLGATNAQFVTIGNINEIGATTINGGSGITLNSGAGPINASGGAVTVSGTAASSFTTTSGSLTLGAGGGSGGGVIVKPQTDSTTAFSVQNANSSTTLLNVDTSGSTVSLGVGSVASFGNTRVGNVGGCCNVGKLQASKFTTVGGGALASISAYVGWGGVEVSPHNQFQLAVYADNGSGTAPGAYIASTTVSTLTTNAGTWYTLPITATLSAGTTYWLTYWNNTIVNDSNNALKYTSPATGAAYQSNATWGSGLDNGMPAAYPSGTLSTGVSFSMYASFTQAGPALVLGAGGLTTASGPVLFQDPTNSPTAFQVQDNVANAILTVDTSNSIVSVTTLAVSGHIITSGSTPAIAAGTAACTSPTVSVSGNDTSGIISITTGSGCAGGGKLATVTFANQFGAAPHVVLTPGSALTAGLNAYVDDSTISTTAFDIGTGSTPANATVYKWNYIVVQ